MNVSKYGKKPKRLKRCIVVKTEIKVAGKYSSDKVHGLYLGNDGTGKSCGRNFTYWEALRENSFPLAKLDLLKKARKYRMQDTERCTANFETNWNLTW